jgi:8-oxo-dGTP diphosphatase
MSPPFPTVPLTVDIIIELPNNKLVLIERRDPPHGIAIPGGFVEPGESAAAAARREALEETGLKVELVDQFHTYSKPGRDHRGPVASVVFIAQASGEPKAGDDAKAIKIIDRIAIPEKMAFDHRDILMDYYNWRVYFIRPPLER